eukprot:scaffold18084_cov16-Tisochrysis_lutea.AAC.2
MRGLASACETCTPFSLSSRFALVTLIAGSRAALCLQHRYRPIPKGHHLLSREGGLGSRAVDQGGAGRGLPEEERTR